MTPPSACTAATTTTALTPHGRPALVGAETESWSAPLVTDALRLLGAWTPLWLDEAEVLDALLTFAAAHPDGGARTCPSGHLTVSTVVVDPDTRRVLLTLHPKFGRWMQLGGHLEPGDATLLDAAVRETIEESGLHRFDGPPRLLRTHYDIRFLVLADHVDAVISEESLDLAWCPLEQLPEPHDARTCADSRTRRSPPWTPSPTRLGGR